MAHDHAPATTSKKRLLIVIGIVSTVFVAEVIGGLLTGSLALLADAGHMLSDLIGLIVALTAMTLAARPASARATYGYRRTEVFGALINGLILCGVSISIALEAIQRLTAPTEAEILPVPMLLVAIVGLAANIVSMLILRAGAKSSINLRGAYLEVFGDMVGSVAVIVAAIIIMLTGWAPADAIVSLAIAAFILPRAYLLLRDVWRVLNESTPVDTSVEDVRAHIARADGVREVHDVHLWSITSGEHVFTAHVVAEDEVFERGEVGALLDRLSDCLHDHFDVEHSTFQIEPPKHAEHEREVHV
ncbi:cobalt-zinc-cadmium efflux system protein [Mycetocola sp. BIGb0189]|uniref:cation diffusion facilitator family transporter n=1 Tax=Mycetocola sp. BIGb0189 TaxID=2940604 RepID=UPI0021695F6F|nr:cation diffusion facilitator family transporter [Mycetocola sp. BIGb0189]MCS4275592.1 cobalt-zinc-cadmium efflux system protein [Mycetocola sp. BIGb0189]